MELGHLLTRSDLTYPEVSSKVCHVSFCQLGNSVSLPLGNLLRGISYEKELDIDNKLHNYLKITGILNNDFRPQKTLKKTRIKLYNTLALPVLLYGSETWTIKARDARRITAAEMKYVYMRRTADTFGQITKQMHKLQRN